MNAIEIVNVTKSYSHKNVLCGIDLSIPQGVICALVGANGSGKTTLLRILAGLIKPTGGRIEILSRIVKPDRSMAEVSFMFEPSPVDERLTAYQNLKLRCLALGQSTKQIPALLQQVGLQNDNKQVKNFSAGMKKRLEFAYALIGSPKILILDEPFTGLDVAGIEILISVLKDYKEQNATVLIAEHNFSVVEKIADSLAVLYQGKILIKIEKNQLTARQQNMEAFFRESIELHEKTSEI